MEPDFPIRFKAMKRMINAYHGSKKAPAVKFPLSELTSKYSSEESVHRVMEAL